MAVFHALPGFYQVLFLYLEPLSMVLPAIVVYGYPGTSWFHQQLIPSSQAASQVLDERTQMAIWQLANCYFLLSLIEAVVFRAVRDTLPQNPQAQERLIGASLAVLAVADVTHIAATIAGLPTDLRFAFTHWNATTHGNVTAVVVLLTARICWFLGIGRSRSVNGNQRKTL